MRGVGLVFVMLVYGIAAGCAARFEVVELPKRSADLYPLALVQGRTAVAVDEVRDAERAYRYFGADLLGHDIVPVVVVVSNHERQPVRVTPADVILYRGSEVVDPLPVHEVAAIARDRGRLKRETQQQIDAYYRQIAFARRAIAPGDTYQGVLFFRLPAPDDGRQGFFRRVSLWMQGDLQLSVVIETADPQERRRFGPYTLQGPSSDWY